jgi:hypothetical protein
MQAHAVLTLLLEQDRVATTYNLIVCRALRRFPVRCGDDFCTYATLDEARHLKGFPVDRLVRIAIARQDDELLRCARQLGAQ